MLGFTCLLPTCALAAQGDIHARAVSAGGWPGTGGSGSGGRGGAHPAQPGMPPAAPMLL